MTTYILRRILLSIPVLFGILFATFALGRLIPGDPCRAMLGEKATDAVCDEFIQRHGLDQPILVQFGYYVNEIAHGDFGRSFRFSKPVGELIMEQLRAKDYVAYVRYASVYRNFKDLDEFFEELKHLSAKEAMAALSRSQVELPLK